MNLTRFPTESDPKLGNKNISGFPHFVCYFSSLNSPPVPSRGIAAHGPHWWCFSHSRRLLELPSVHGEGKQPSLNQKTSTSHWLSCDIQHSLLNLSYNKVSEGPWILPIAWSRNIFLQENVNELHPICKANLISKEAIQILVLSPKGFGSPLSLKLPLEDQSWLFHNVGSQLRIKLNAL